MSSQSSSLWLGRFPSIGMHRVGIGSEINQLGESHLCIGFTLWITRIIRTITRTGDKQCSDTSADAINQAQFRGIMRNSANSQKISVAVHLTIAGNSSANRTCFLQLLHNMLSHVMSKTTFWWQYFFTDAACSLLYVGCRYLFVAMWLNLSYYTRDTVWLLLHVDVRSRQTFRVEVYHFPFTLNWEELCVIQQIRRKLLWLFTWQGQGILQLTAHVSRN